MSYCLQNRFVISKSKLIGYITIYFMLLCNQSNFGEIHMTPYRTIIMLILLGVSLIKTKGKINKYCFLFISFLVAYALLLRVSVGGIGIQIIAQFLVDILAVWLAISINKQYFWERFVKTVVFLASISLILWLLSVLQINIWDQITPEVDSLMSYRIYSDSSTYKEIAYKLHGMFLYSHRNVDMRNVSIFTEPGIYQMVLNTAIFVLLFFRDKLVSFSDKKVGHALMILSCALLSTQSTTGYMSLCFIVLFYMLFEKKVNTERNWKQKICIVLFAMLLFLMIDYMVRGNESFIQISVISKLFSGEKKLSLDESGMARADVIFLAIQSMVKHPFGVGYSRFGALMNVESTGMAGAAIMQFGAAWGILPLIAVIWWIFYPALKFCKKRYVAVVYIIMYINTVLAQSDLFYPTLIMIPIGLYSLHSFNAAYFAIKNDREEYEKL